MYLAKTLGAVALVNLVASMFLGKLLPGVVNFVVGATVLASVALLVLKAVPEFKGMSIEPWPGFFVGAGFVALAAALQFLTNVLLAIFSAVAKVDLEKNEAFFAPGYMVIHTAFAFLPIFSYGGYLGLQFAALIG